MSLRRTRPPAASRLARWLGRLRGIPALVWGDFVLDEYWRCRTARVSREAPVLVLDYEARTVQGGGAANAALNLAAMGAEVAVAGWIGRDEAGGELRRLLASSGIDTRGLLERKDAPTVVKTRIVAGDAHTSRQQVVRVDRGRPFPLGHADRAAMRATVRRLAAKRRAVILSDYGYDAVTPALAARWIAAWRRGGATVGLDARYRLAAYRGVTLATPNEGEAAQAAGEPVQGTRDLERVAGRLCRRLAVEHLIITLGRDGLTLWSRGRGAHLACFGPAEAVDVTGAGDAVVAAATLALAAGAPPLVAAALANVAGSVAVGRRGAVPVAIEDLTHALGAEAGA